MRELVTTLLDVFGLLLVAAGVAWGLGPVIGGWSIAAAGAVVLAGSWLASVGGPVGAVAGVTAARRGRGR